jgi:BON domain-containing protein
VTICGHLTSFRCEQKGPRRCFPMILNTAAFGPSRAQCENMKNFLRCYLWPALLSLAVLSGCSNSTQTGEVSANIRMSLDLAGFKEVSVAEDRDKDLVILRGNVASDAEKVQAAALAAGFAGAWIVSNQIAVVPPGGATDSRMLKLALDKRIGSAVSTVPSLRNSPAVKPLPLNQGMR